MARELEILIGQDLGYYDPVTGRALLAEKVVDLTDDCKFDEVDHGCALLFYSRDTRFGTIVQFIWTYNPDALMGMSTALSLNTLRPGDVVSYARGWGYRADELVEIAKQNAPIN